MGSSSKMTKNHKRSYAYIVRESTKKKDHEPLKEDMQKPEMKNREEDECAWKKSLATHNNIHIRPAPAIRRPPIPRYQFFFFGFFYAWNNYGHKVVDCRAYALNRNTWSRNRHQNSRYMFEGNCVRKLQVSPDKTHNRFGVLNYEIECYKCNNFGHIARNCRSRFTGSSSHSRENRQVP